MEFGPIYNIDSAALKKFRAKKEMSREERQAYGAAVEAAVLASQRAALKRAAVPERRPNCASGTWHTTGDAIHKAVREQQRAALLACPDQIRRARTRDQWNEMYRQAMGRKSNG